MNPKVREIIGFRAGLIIALLVGIFVNIFVWKFNPKVVVNNYIFITISVMLIIGIWKTLRDYQKALDVHMIDDHEKEYNKDILVIIHKLIDNAIKNGEQDFLQLRKGQESCCFQKIVYYFLKGLLLIWLILFLIAIVFMNEKYFPIIATIWFIILIIPLRVIRKYYFKVMVSVANRLSLNVVYYPDVEFPSWDVRDYELVFDLRSKMHYFRYIEKDTKIEEECFRKMEIKKEKKSLSFAKLFLFK